MASRRQHRLEGRAPPRSVYRKVQVVLKEARRRKSASVDDLVGAIDKRGHLDFTYYSTESGPAKVIPCERRAIRRIVNMCAFLRFIDESSAQLTREGLRACNPERFDEMMVRAIRRGMRQLGTSVDEVKRVVQDLLVNFDGESLPTWDAIYDRLGCAQDGRAKKRFRTYLSLLSVCNGIRYSRKKIYLP